MNRRQRIWAISGIVILIGLGLFFGLGPGRAFTSLWRHGVIQAAVTDNGEDRKYDASREANLKAIRIALNLYEDSEGAYPTATGWMDAIKSHLRSTDMSDSEAAKKLVRPNIPNPQPNEFGYAINDEVTGKYKGDLKDPKTVLVFESSDIQRNAHGKPTDQLGEMAIAMDGTIVKL